MRSIQDPEERGGGGHGPRGGSPRKDGLYLRFVHLGTQMAITILLGVFGGIWLDKKFHTGSVLTVVGSLAGIGLGMAIIIRETGAKRP